MKRNRHNPQAKKSNKRNAAYKTGMSSQSLIREIFTNAKKIKPGEHYDIRNFLTHSTDGILSERVIIDPGAGFRDLREKEKKISEQVIQKEIQDSVKEVKKLIEKKLLEKELIEKGWLPSKVFFTFGVKVLSLMVSWRKLGRIRKITDNEVSNDDPPKRAEILLHAGLSKRDREHVIGDLDEDFRTLWQPNFGARTARRLYWAHAIRTVVAINLGRARYWFGLATDARAADRNSQRNGR